MSIVHEPNAAYVFIFFYLIELHSFHSVKVIFECCIGLTQHIFERVKESAKGHASNTHSHFNTITHGVALAYVISVRLCCVYCSEKKNDDAICCCNDVSHCVHFARSLIIVVYLKISKFISSERARGFGVACTMHIAHAQIVITLCKRALCMCKTHCILTFQHTCIRLCLHCVYVPLSLLLFSA